MSASLREPFFLRGRRKVLQRAVLMSLVLGRLSACVAWTLTLILLAGGHGDWLDYLFFGLVFTALVDEPLNVWVQRSWLCSLPAILLAPLLVNAHAMRAVESTGHGIRHWQLVGQFTLSDCVGGCAAFAAIHGVLLIRLDRGGFVAYAVSVVSRGLVGAIAYGIHREWVATMPWMHVAYFSELQNLCTIGILTLWIAALCVPWGIPLVAAGIRYQTGIRHHPVLGVNLIDRPLAAARLGTHPCRISRLRRDEACESPKD